MKIEQSVFDAIGDTVASMGYEIVDIEYIKIGNDMNLTIYIDIPSGVSLDDCEKVHMAIDPIIDELNPTEDKPYILNVSSPGLDRQFKTQRDFERNYNKEVELKLYAPLMGKKLYEGVLAAHDANSTVILCDGKEITIENNKIAFVRPLVKFE